MQAEIHNGTKIDFYPAFNPGDTTVAAYKFAVKDKSEYTVGGAYTDVTASEANLSMKDIYNKLQPASGTKTTTLYYQKTDTSADSLKCYTVKDLSWNYVFGEDTASSGGVATAYSPEFTADYQKDSSGKDNGIKTALLASDGFGSN